MAGSLKTAFFNLVKYAANDITSWLTDFNGNMDKIDTALNQNKTAAQAAQDGVDNLNSEYETVVQTLANHTNQIDANEKAIAENSASIEEIENQVNEIKVTNKSYFNQTDNKVTNIEPLCTAIQIVGCAMAENFSGSIGMAASAGTFHSYDRQASIPGNNNAYITDLFRISGNVFNLSANKWTRMVGTEERDGRNVIISDIVICYDSSANFTIIGYAKSTSNKITFSANSEIYVNC